MVGIVDLEVGMSCDTDCDCHDCVDDCVECDSCDCDCIECDG